MIEIHNLSLQLADFSLRDIDLKINDKEYFVILGPTGAGKTVLLECMAGLQRFPKGKIWINGDQVNSLPPEKRGIGYVPQDYALFPFLDVRENIIFGLRHKKADQNQIREQVDYLTHMLGISHLLKREVNSLSGGEKQRVALARALAVSPKVLLLDEPLGSVDVRTAKYLRLELKRYHEQSGTTTIHVTHNLMEAEEMADRMAVLNEGQLEQVGTTEDVFFYPRSEIVSDLLGTPNILHCDQHRSLGHGMTEAVCGGISIVLPYQADGIKKIALFPRDIYVSTSMPPGPELNRFRGSVMSITPFSSLTRLQVKAGGNLLLAELPTDTFQNMNITVGQQIFLILKLRRLRIH